MNAAAVATVAGGLVLRGCVTVVGVVAISQRSQRGSLEGLDIIHGILGPCDQHGEYQHDGDEALHRADASAVSFDRTTRRVAAALYSAVTPGRSLPAPRCANQHRVARSPAGTRRYGARGGRGTNALVRRT